MYNYTFLKTRCILQGFLWKFMGKHFQHIKIIINIVIIIIIIVIVVVIIVCLICTAHVLY